MVSKSCVPWLTYPQKIIHNERDRASRKYRASKSSENWHNFRELRNFALESIRQEKTAYLHHLINQSINRCISQNEASKAVIENSPESFSILRSISILQLRLKLLE